MAIIYLRQINYKDPVSVIQFIVNTVPDQVKAAIKRINGLNVDRYTNVQLVNLLSRWMDQGYNISPFTGSLQYYGQYAKPAPKFPGGVTQKNEDGSELEEVVDSQGQTFTQILSAISDFINSASGFAQLFVPDNSNLPPDTPPTTGSKINQWLYDNSTLVGFGLLVIVGGILAWIFRKKIIKT